jgi:hypothetical protein
MASGALSIGGGISVVIALPDLIRRLTRQSITFLGKGDVGEGLTATAWISYSRPNNRLRNCHNTFAISAKPEIGFAAGGEGRGPDALDR